MPYAMVNDLRLYYEQARPSALVAAGGTGPPLVLLNGGTGTIDAPVNGGGWGPLRTYLAQRYHVVHVEHRGHGRTDNPGGGAAYTLSALAADVVALIEQLGLAPAHVAGFSEGGMVGLGLALAHASAVRSVVGIGARYTHDAKSDAARHWFDPEWVEREDPARAADLARRHDAHHAPGHWRDLLRWIVAADFLDHTADRTVADLQRIAVPTLWIAGENDPFFELDQLLTMKRHIPGAELLIVNHADHFVQLTHPHLVGPVIADFLGRHDAPRRP
jgi:3-oxoadipate enol-lactonase